MEEGEEGTIDWPSPGDAKEFSTGRTAPDPASHDGEVNPTPISSLPMPADVSTTELAAAAVIDNSPVGSEWTDSESGGEGLQWSKASVEKTMSPTRIVGKVRAEDHGWTKLPASVLSRILGYAIEEPDMSEHLFSTWVERPDSMRLVKMLLRKTELVNFRLVSRHWKVIIDAMPFWQAYNLAFALVRTPREPHMTGSRPAFPSAFHESRHLTRYTCTICLINKPHRGPWFPARAVWTQTAKFSYITGCAIHTDYYCQNCLIADPEWSISRTGQILTGSDMMGRRLGILPTSWTDTDEEGKEVEEGLRRCHHCRQAAVEWQMNRILTACARGGPVRGLGAWDEDLGTETLSKYLDRGRSTAKSTAMDRADTLWLQFNSRRMEKESIARDMQEHERRLKIRYCKTFEEPNFRDVRFRADLWASLLGLAQPDVAMLTAARAELLKAKQEWGVELSCLEDDEEWDDEDIEDGPEEYLNANFASRLREACVIHWTRVRVRSGIWMTVRDEVRSLIPSADEMEVEGIATVEDIAQTAIYPLIRYADPPLHPVKAVLDHFIRIDLNYEGSFLPPASVVRALDGYIASHLRQTLIGPFVELTRLILWIYNGDRDLAEAHCTTWTNDKLLMYLRFPQLWEKNGLIGHLKNCNGGSLQIARLKCADLLGVPLNNISSTSEEPETTAAASRANTSPIEGSPIFELVDQDPVSTPTYKFEIDMDKGSALDADDKSPPGVGLDQAASAKTIEQTIPPSGEDIPAQPLTTSGHTMLGKRKISPGEAEMRTVEQHKKASHPNTAAVTGDSRRGLSTSPHTAGSDETSTTADSAIAPLTPDDLDELRTDVPPASKQPFTDAEAASSPASSSTASMDTARSLSDLDLHTDFSTIPWIPTVPCVGLGPEINRLLESLWWDVRAELRACSCRICLRARDQGLERRGDQWIAGWEGEKRFRTE